MPPLPDILGAATEAEAAAFKWVVRRRGFRYLDEFLFFPLLLGGINLGYLSVNFYFRPGVARVEPIGWRIRPDARGEEKATEARLITMQEEGSTTIIVRIRDQDVLRRRATTLRNALDGRELP